MSSSTCPICAHVAYPYFSYSDFFGHDIQLAKCLNCGHGFHAHAYVSEQFDKMYAAQYARDYLTNETESFQQRQIQYSQDIDLLLESETTRPHRVLDFGCSSGFYLQAMPSEWKKSGLEVNPVHVAHLREKFPSFSIYSDLEDVKETFDLITLRGVIEHIPDHSTLIGFIREHLETDGLLYISATPDFSSACAALYHESWNQISCPEHIHQFTSASLCLLLARAGLVLRSLHHPYLGTPYANWEKDSRCFLDAAAGNASINGRHASCGNMMSAIFKKVR